MKIVVLMKDVPDTYGDRQLSPETGLVERGSSDHVPDEITERALEAALRYAEAHEGVTVRLVSMGAAEATATVRKGLAMGADSALQVLDDDLVGADLSLTAEVLAAAIRREAPDLVVAGNLSTDGTGGVIPAMVAERLGWAALTNLAELDIAEAEVSGTRVSDTGRMRLTAALPAVVSVTEGMPDPRYVNFKGIMAAKKKQVDTVGVAELGVHPLDPEAARTIMTEVSQKPPRTGGVKIVDEGDAAERLVEFLVENKLV